LTHSVYAYNIYTSIKSVVEMKYNAMQHDRPNYQHVSRGEKAELSTCRARRWCRSVPRREWSWRIRPMNSRTCTCRVAWAETPTWTRSETPDSI